MILKQKLDVTKLFIALALILVIVQIGSILYTNIYGGTPLKLGWAFFLLLIVTAMTSTFVLGKKIGQLNKTDLIFIIIEFVAIILIFYYLPKIVPEIFSVFPHV